MSEGTSHDAEETVITDRFAVLDHTEDIGVAGIVAAWEVMDQETWSFISDVADDDPQAEDSRYVLGMSLLLTHTNYALDMASFLTVAGVDLDTLWPAEDHHDNHPLRSAQVGIQSLAKVEDQGYRWKLADMTTLALRIQEAQAGIRAERTKDGQ